MKKSTQQAIEKFYKDCEIDSRTLPMIVHHYLSIGEQAASTLTKARIEEVYLKAVEEEQAATARGAVYMITPEFQKYILTACQQLYLLPADVKYAIIKLGL